MASLYSQSDNVRGFASEYGVDVDTDIRRMGRFTPILVHLDGIGRPVTHVTDDSGADYYIARIDYYRSFAEIHASRVIAIVMPGYRTKLAYWTKAAAKKELIVHRGNGYLIIGNPDQEELDSFNTSIFPIDPDVTPRVTLPPGRFYTLQAAAWSQEPLVVSGLCETDRNGNWESMEIAVEPGQEVLVTPDGLVEVPDDFVAAQFN